MELAVGEAFERMDAEHAAQLSSSSPKIDGGSLRQLLGWFYSSEQRVGYIFSLNQDLLMERLAGFRVDVGVAQSPIFPGFRQCAIGSARLPLFAGITPGDLRHAALISGVKDSTLLPARRSSRAVIGPAAPAPRIRYGLGARAR
jgi:hypothetical protein